LAAFVVFGGNIFTIDVVGAGAVISLTG